MLILMIGGIVLLIIGIAFINLIDPVGIYDNVRIIMGGILFYCIIHASEDYKYHEYKKAARYLLGVIGCIVVIALRSDKLF